MSPGPVERLKPYFKPRPRARAAGKPTAPPAPPAAQASPPPQQGTASAAPATAPPPASPPAQRASGADGAGLRARRDQLARRFAELQSDLGGLAYEMAIRDSFRHDVLTRRAAELQSVDRELTAVEQQLGGGAQAVSCPACGTPAQSGSQYCARCGAAIAGQRSGGAG